MAESPSKKRVASPCFLKMDAGHAEERGASNVFLTASALVGPGTMEKIDFAEKMAGIVRVTAFFGTSSRSSKHPSFTCCC